MKMKIMRCFKIILTAILFLFPSCTSKTHRTETSSMVSGNIIATPNQVTPADLIFLCRNLKALKFGKPPEQDYKYTITLDLLLNMPSGLTQAQLIETFNRSAFSPRGCFYRSCLPATDDVIRLMSKLHSAAYVRLQQANLGIKYMDLTPKMIALEKLLRVHQDVSSFDTYKDQKPVTSHSIDVTE